VGRGPYSRQQDNMMCENHPGLVSDTSTVERANCVIQITNEAIGNLSSQERDRLMQVHLAQARGPVRNGDLLRQGVDRALDIRNARAGEAGVRPMDDALIDMLCAVCDALEKLDIPYAVTGSVASSVHGEPFSSLDVDLVLLASAGDAARLSTELSPRFYAPEDMLTEAARAFSFVNVVDNRTSLKVDLSFIGSNPFLRLALERRMRTRIGSHPREFWFVTPEDVILMKLLWRKDTRSQKQWDNALSVARVQGARMDWKYLFEQAKNLGIEEDLVKLRDEAGI